MIKRSATRSSLELEEFCSTSGNGMVEVNPVSRSISHAEEEAEAAADPTPSHGATSDAEQVDSPSRSEVEDVEESSSLHAYLALLCLVELRCRNRLELLAFCLATISSQISHRTISA